MHDDDVVDGEMRWLTPDRDEIDLVFSDEILDDDVADVAAIVHDLRSAYLPDESMPRSEALASFTGAHRNGVGESSTAAAHRAIGSDHQIAGHPHTDESKENHPMIKVLSAIAASVAGKALLGTAVAAASVGGLHAAQVIDVPGLPEQANERAFEARGLEADEPEADEPEADEPEADEPEADEPEADEPEADEPEAGEPEADEPEADQPEADDLESEAADGDDPSDFSQAMQEWSACVGEAASQHDAATAAIDASVDGAPEPFDPEAACGPLPALYDHPTANRPDEVQERIEAVRAWADCVAENAPDHADACGDNPAAADHAANPGPPSEVPGNRPDDAGPPAEVPGDRPDDAGPPADVPSSPSDAPNDAGPPAEVPGDRPDDAGPPAEAPGDRPDDAGPPSDPPSDAPNDPRPPAEGPADLPVEPGPPADAPGGNRP